ncbi:MAG: pullulanase-type alpha-1,6-glucosidase [Verrucomicrobia bacterium]|nr:pullulanase-type alpha-1,6-glucosidase [Verrucomicrobiota bacterium]
MDPAETKRIGDLRKAKAHWVSRDTIVWPGAEAGRNYRLYHAPNGGIHVASGGVEGGSAVGLQVAPEGIPVPVLEKLPQLAGATALKLPEEALGDLCSLLKGQLIVVKAQVEQPLGATSLQVAGVLDDEFYYAGPLGAEPNRNGVVFRLWAPTARSVRLLIFDEPAAGKPEAIYRLTPRSRGLWSLEVNDPAWVNHKYYLYEVEVFAREQGKVVTNRVTDPYSLGLSANSTKSLVVDLNSPLSRPASWGAVPKPPLRSVNDIVLYELHVRDFSAVDETVPEQDRGKYTAFNHPSSNGMRHLASLAAAGLTHLHLLPAFDFSSVPEPASEQKRPQIEPCPDPASTQPQAAVAAVKDQDAYNWGYDPCHYTVPEGSYATSPHGLTRIREFREMVQALHAAGLRVVMDVVYNHTAAAGQDPASVLDRIVPGYYHRLDGDGDPYTNTCGPATASEHRMFEKLMIDSLSTWAGQYGIDGFRFDLMGFHFRQNLLRIREALQKIDSSIYLYGEGWDFGEVARNALGLNATQANMAGTGIGTFNDRGRDAIRGGLPFDRGERLMLNQGFVNGLWYDNNGERPPNRSQQIILLHLTDLARLALAGTLQDYVLVDKDGNRVTGAQLEYCGRPAGYALQPGDVINYVAAHDNQTLFDNDQYKLPAGTPMADRVRVNNLALATVALAQGIPFFHAGDELLRSKSFDRNSYNSGDWFNRLDFSYRTNNYGVGLPPEEENGAEWPLQAPLLRNPELKPAYADIVSAHQFFLELLRIRRSTPLFRLPTGDEIKARVAFGNTGPGQQPGLIVMTISDRTGADLDPDLRSVVVFFNADKVPKVVVMPEYTGLSLELHPIQRASAADQVVRESGFDARSGTFTIPARTTAVFIEPG